MWFIVFTSSLVSDNGKFTINIENTLKEITDDVISKSDEKIELEKISIFESGLIEGHDLESYDIALNMFMDTLTKIRRNI